MSITIRNTMAILAIMLAAVAVMVPVSAFGAEAPVKEILTSHLGWEVDPISKGTICTVISGHECQPGKRNGGAGGFEYPEVSAGARNGNVYIADRGNHRVQELTAAGAFVLMFGLDVNRKKVTEAAKGGSVTQAEEDVCKAGEECQAGVEGPAPGQFGESILGMAVDPVSGDVYVADLLSTGGERVQEFTGEGVFVLEIGREVNETKVTAVKAKGGSPSQKELEEENLCTQEEVIAKSVKCTSPAFSSKAEPGVFVGIGGIAVGGPEDRLYVGEHKRVQEFNGTGEPVGEPAESISARLAQISPEPESHVSAIAVDDSCSLHEPVLSESTTPTCKEFDPSYGDVYLTYRLPSTGGSTPASVIRRFDAAGKETEFPLSPRIEGATVYVAEGEMALDPSGRIAVIELEDSSTSNQRRGVLYQAGATGLHLITEFAIADTASQDGMAFNGSDDLYIANQEPGYEVSAYDPVPVGELVSGAVSCAEGVAVESSATFDCGLNGQVDPWGVPQTEAWFQWGRTVGLGEETSKQIVCASSCGSALVGVAPAVVEGLRPNETFYYQLAGHDLNVRSPESLTSERSSFATPTTPPRIVGESSVSYVHFSSVVFYGEVNPENAPTVYSFQYGACASGLEGCAETFFTEPSVSNAYGAVASTLEATGLQPATTYHYRLVAVNEHEQTGIGPEQTFTTSPAPVPRAQTGSASMIAATSATVSGSVNPDGQAAVYTFELGIYNGADTRYGIVLSAPAGASSTPIEKSVALSGLQPGTTYAYRITVKSGFGEQDGATVTFTTQGLPAVLVSPVTLGLLPVPGIAFPKPALASKAKKAKAKAKVKPKRKKVKRKKKKK